MASPAEQEAALEIMTTSVTHERAVAMRQAAREIMGIVSVKAYDPTIPDERANYIGLITAREKRNYEAALVEFDAPTQPRTTEQIERYVVDHAIENNFELLAIEHRMPGGLDEFWTRVAQIVAANS